MKTKELILTKFSGTIESNDVYITLIIQTVVVLIAGIVLWRLSNYLHFNKMKRRANEKFETKYSKAWKTKK